MMVAGIDSRFGVGQRDVRIPESRDRQVDVDGHERLAGGLGSRRSRR